MGLSGVDCRKCFTGCFSSFIPDRFRNLIDRIQTLFLSGIEALRACGNRASACFSTRVLAPASQYPACQVVIQKDGLSTCTYQEGTHRWTLSRTPESSQIGEAKPSLHYGRGSSEAYKGILKLGRKEKILEIRAQNIFESGAEVIVNAANSHLGGGGGIDGAIHQRWNSFGCQKAQLAVFNFDGYERSEQKAYIPGHAVMIALPEAAIAKEKEKGSSINSFIVVCGPNLQGRNKPTEEDEKQLYFCYYNALCIANATGKKSIAFPAISTGIFGYPKREASAVSLRAIYHFLEDHPDAQLEQISIHFSLPNPADTDQKRFAEQKKAWEENGYFTPDPHFQE